jgi:hypothetical protein
MADAAHAHARHHTRGRRRAVCAELRGGGDTDQGVGAGQLRDGLRGPGLHQRALHLCLQVRAEMILRAGLGTYCAFPPLVVGMAGLSRYWKLPSLSTPLAHPVSSASRACTTAHAITSSGANISCGAFLAGLLGNARLCGVESVRWSQRLRQCHNRRERCAPATTADDTHAASRIVKLTHHNSRHDTRVWRHAGFNVSCPGGLNKCSQCQTSAGCIDCNGLPFGTSSNAVRANFACIVCLACRWSCRWSCRVVSCRVVLHY